MASSSSIWRQVGRILGQILGSFLQTKNPSAGSAAKNSSGTRRSSSSSKTKTTIRSGPAATSSGADTGPSAQQAQELALRERALVGEPSPGQLGESATFEVDAPGSDELTISYAPKRDDAPDAGEVVWTWIPYEERDGRGKDRPVLVIGARDASYVYAVRLTSKAHDGDRDFLPIGPGPWDSQGRASWLDVDQVYIVHIDGMRREASALDRKTFDLVAAALTKRYGWRQRS